MQFEHNSDGDVIDEPVFVVGADRSGTTLLRLMLNGHPGLAIPPESQFIVRLMRELPTTGVLSVEQVDTATKIITDCPGFSTWRTAPKELGEAFSSHRRPTLSGLVDAVYRLEIEPTSKARWGDKTPLYASFITEIDGLFPRARFIHIIRDGRDVSLSLRNVAWWGWTEYERARYWARVVRTADRAGALLGASRYLRVAYEDLVLDTETVLEQVCVFLGVEMCDQMTSFHETAFDHLTDSEKETGIHDKLSRPPRDSDVDRWRTESSPLRVFLFESIAGREMDRVGASRHFGGALRWFVGFGGAVYTPVGALVSAVHRGFDGLPDSIRTSLRMNRPLRWMKKALVRC